MLSSRSTERDECRTYCSNSLISSPSKDKELNEISSNMLNYQKSDERRLLEEKIDNLRQRILAAEKERKKLMAIKDEARVLQRIQMEKRNQAQRKKDITISNLESVRSRRVYMEQRLETLYRNNAINDCFHIWHQRPYGTINGLRAGSFIPPVCSEICINDLDNLNQGGLDFDLSSMFPISASTGFFRDQVTWFETNSALGTAALLLSTLQQKPGTNIEFSAYDIIPMGSYSKIVAKVKGNAVPTVYNLYSDDRFSFFGKRSFNKALQGLLRCLLDAGETVILRDKTMEYPYPITDDTTTGELAIGGLSINYGTDAERWTRALKYLLTDLKWLVAFVMKHAER